MDGNRSRVEILLEIVEEFLASIGCVENKTVEGLPLVIIGALVHLDIGEQVAELGDARVETLKRVDGRLVREESIVKETVDI